MFKNVHFFEKTCKNRFKVGGSASETHTQTTALLLLSPISSLSSVFLTLNLFYYPETRKNDHSKCSSFSSFTLLHLFFTSNTVIFVDVGGRNISCPRAQGTLATLLNLSYEC